MGGGNVFWFGWRCLVIFFILSVEGGSETESTVDSDFGRCDLLATTSSDPFFSFKPRYSTVI